MAFLVFCQADSSLTRKYPGVGLGLNICQLIIERHEGSIRVESKVNEGSTFHIDFPIKEHFANCMSSSN
ncbi:ATP-binding protein [uncultured Methanolobus sp.]|uniref:ATP-binding protein n=1 Tax=uncultured Methanolobus sp. TaxID=218300 RepID=UPI0029C8BA18|nr:ATP-binding protein [uncultured Methanolobus sp.]